MRLESLPALLLVGSLCTAPRSRAAEPADAPQAPAPQGGAAGAPAPEVPPQQEAPAPAAPAGESLVRVYGTLLTRIVASDAATESFNQPNAVAITAAGNPVLSVDPSAPRYTLQAQQSRFGLWVNEKGPFRGQLELDFADFSKSSPTVASMPRLRIARVDWLPEGGHVLSLGQDWDLHAPVNPHTLNLVGLLFQAGNAGFMRQQLRDVYTRGALEAGVALGLPFPNTTNREASPELDTPPTLAARVAWKPGRSRVGVSAIATALRLGPRTPAGRTAPAFSTSAFADLMVLPTTNVRAELSYGRNSGNLGLLTLAQGSPASDLTEAGGFVSVRHAFTAHHAVYGLVGTQHVLSGTILPSYSVPAGGTGAPDPAAVQLAGTGPGMRNNTAARLAYEFRPFPALALAVEGFLYRSHHVLRPEDLARGVGPVARAVGLEAGAMLTF